MNEQSIPWWRGGTKLPIAVVLAIGALFLWTEYRVQVIEFLPMILVLACVGMHLFMHGGRGHGGGHDHGAKTGPSAGDAEQSAAHMTHSGHHDHQQAGGNDKHVDPVCDKHVDPKQGYGKVHEGTLYRFCSRECLDTFETEPARYMNKQGQEA